MQDQKAYQTKEYRKQFFFGRNIKKQKQIEISKVSEKSETNQKYKKTDLKLKKPRNKLRFLMSLKKAETDLKSEKKFD